MKKIFITLTALLLTSTIAFAGTFKADAKTKRIASGTNFQLEFIQPVSTSSGLEGDSFTAMLKNDLTAENSVILPKGSVVRGSISTVKIAKRFSRGGMLYLDFDHVVTPNGRQIPLDLAIYGYDKINYDGGLYKNLGYGEALKENYGKSAKIVQKAIDYGFNVEDYCYGLQYLTVPLCAIGGFIGASGYYVGQGVADMFRKGKDVYINAGDVIDVRLINPIDIPVY